MEHRGVRRYRVALPVTYFWGSGSNFFEGNGTTRDVSTDGVFVVTSDVVVSGSELWLKVSLPGLRAGSSGSEMQGNGQVVRAERGGFAVRASIGFSTDTDSAGVQRGKSSGRMDRTERRTSTSADPAIVKEIVR